MFEEPDPEDDTEVFYAAYEHDEAHSGCAGCFVLPAITLLLVTIFLLLQVL
ncbi:MAG TPA: hypothetical protein VMM38_03075 [Aridibacter sp.]|nr:hypothetical protein [Aridibacter sp.]